MDKCLNICLLKKSKMADWDFCKESNLCHLVNSLARDNLKNMLTMEKIALKHSNSSLSRLSIDFTDRVLKVCSWGNFYAFLECACTVSGGRIRMETAKWAKRGCQAGLAEPSTCMEECKNDICKQIRSFVVSYVIDGILHNVLDLGTACSSIANIYYYNYSFSTFQTCVT